MFRNFIKAAIRSLLRQKVYSLINVAGLAVGLASSMLITLFIVHELSYDRFQSKQERIYRLCVKGRIGDKTFIENDVLWADSTFFNIFDFRLQEGDPNQVPAEPNTIVLTQDMSRKYFGNEDPVGKSIPVFMDGILYRITGIVENYPENSHMTFNFLLSFHSRSDASRTVWLSHNIHTYFLLSPGTDVDLLEEKIHFLRYSAYWPYWSRASDCWDFPDTLQSSEPWRSA
jgi:putative ABC transport system permease protein